MTHINAALSARFHVELVMLNDTLLSSLIGLFDFTYRLTKTVVIENVTSFPSVTSKKIVPSSPVALSCAPNHAVTF